MERPVSRALRRSRSFNGKRHMRSRPRPNCARGSSATMTSSSRLKGHSSFPYKIHAHHFFSFVHYQVPRSSIDPIDRPSVDRPSYSNTFLVPVRPTCRSSSPKPRSAASPPSPGRLPFPQLRGRLSPAASPCTRRSPKEPRTRSRRSTAPCRTRSSTASTSAVGRPPSFLRRSLRC